ncbi:O-methyltransferase [Pedobacter gandavensis]|uniref:Methyltransferase domain-containing protein n=1 Tax=Pedobacter gandavensis TaxID=2679963 RepID=A0ABR6ERN5_9SPHI|nr:class I SAM-dependent methyltransferase [Pedobacter gandavensis]MBB2147717.1 methyltransferase domain-containing protein [Pedobacter gandavensis]
MIEEIKQKFPEAYMAIDEATKDAGFSMASATMTCSLLQTLAASKPGGAFLELGTGTGLSTSWILEGMDPKATLISIDHDPQFLDIAKHFLGGDERLKLECMEGEDWVLQNKNQKFDYIFADTWHGKYLLLDEVLEMLNPGAFYIIDDMLPQENWPEGHAEKAIRLIEDLEQREDLILTKQCWATGIVIATKKAQ